MLFIQYYQCAKEAASIVKILFQRANEVLIKACLKHILLWTTNEWLTKLIHIFPLQTILLPYTHDNISEKVHSSKKMHFLDKVLPALGKTVVYFANFFFSTISGYFCKIIHGKPTDNEFRVYDGKSRSDFLTNRKIKM